MKPINVVFLAVGLLCAAASGAPTLVLASGGVAWDTISRPGSPGLATSSPGSSFTIDFTSPLKGQASAPYTPTTLMLMLFNNGVSYNTLHIQLDSDPNAVLDLPPTAPSTSSTTIFLYDPLYGTGAGNAPSMEFPNAWRSELADGVLSGHIWVDGAASQYSMLTVQTTFVVPEPATLSLLALSGVAMLRRRRR